MKEKKSLKRRVDLAEKRAADCERRMRDMRREMRRCNAISDGSQIMISILASRIGPSFHVPKDDVERGKGSDYVVRINQDGSYDFSLRELVGADEEIEG